LGLRDSPRRLFLLLTVAGDTPEVGPKRPGGGLRWPGKRSSALRGARRYRVEAEGLGLPFWPIARLAQDEEPGGSGDEARGGGRLGKEAVALIVALQC
jgi:hypothetical protein